MTKAKIMVDTFLHKRFPNWKENKKTYMVPPIFQASQSVFQTGVAECVRYSDPGDNGESIVYDLLQKLGDDEGMGMFVIHGFVLANIGKWNKKYENNQVPKSKSATGESDFIIFHHQLGVVAIEVKNLTKARNKKIVDAEQQLERSRQLLLAFTESTDSDANGSLSIPFKKVIALPSTKKADFNPAEFHGLGEDRLVLFNDNSEDFTSFRQWWFETIESAPAIQMSLETRAAYEKALSYILMIRHTSPVVETEYIAKIYESLVNYKYNYNDGAGSYFSQIDENTYPFFSSWCWNVFNEKDEKGSRLSQKESKRLQKDFMKSNQLMNVKYEEEEGKETLMKFLDEFLGRSKNKYINGDQFSLMDDAISALFDDSSILVIKNILKFYIKMRKMWPEIKHQDSELYSEEEVLETRPFLKLESAKHVRELERHLSKFSFIEEGEEPTEVDRKLFESLTCKMRLKHARQPIVMTSEQLVVFEGPRKQLIIGPPGSGKTELLKFKALELHDKMKTCKIGKKIMYILANGSPGYREKNSLFFYHIKEFFNQSHLVDVMSIVLEEESAEDTEHTTSKIREKISSGEYEHVFIDEYWIGSKPFEHKIILELVRGIPGYVWISSVFDYHREKIEHDNRMIERTQPLLTALEENNGVVSYLTQVMRPANKIIELEREYSKLYKDRTYPYGTQKILGHSYEGLPVTWAVEKNVNEMYERCVKLVARAVADAPMPLKSIMENRKLILDLADILIVDFAVRMNESSQPEQSLQDRLTNNGIQVSTFNESLEDFMRCKTGKVTLLQSAKREISEFVDGVEWPMVIVILPSSLVVEKPKIRNYDPYISFFRTMVKLVVISDLWENKDMFLSDIANNI